VKAKEKEKHGSWRRRPAAERLLNRELSSLALVERVLQLASDDEQPLLERVRFCSIVSTILDELFMIRVAGLLDQVESGLTVRSADGRLPRETLTEIREGVLAIGRTQSKLWAHDLRPALAEGGIVVGSIDDLSK
jgi:polyphosphate kinase